MPEFPGLTKVKLKIPQAVELSYRGRLGDRVTVKIDKFVDDDFECVTWLSDENMEVIGSRNFEIIA